ncbi:MAG: phosphoglucomutase/phosphomannomutase family protein [Candidatus Saccharicenans sp.]
MIRFGTSGWRAIMGEEFTFTNVRRVVQAIANYLRRNHSDGQCSVVIGYDTRFLSERFAEEAAALLSKNRIQVYLADRDCPSQALAYQIIKGKHSGGINFTASFNPPEFNGLKFNVDSGAPALPEVTQEIEREVEKITPESVAPYFYPDRSYIHIIDLQKDYLEFLQGKIDFAAIRKAGVKIGIDLLFGTGREYLDEILEENGIPIEVIHGYVDPYFGGISPSCTEANLNELKRLVREKGCALGMATDADGDRFGIVDEKGRLVPANYVLSLILEYLLAVKGWRGGVARSVTTTHLIDRIACHYDVPLYRTPVGFKYIADLILQNKIIFGGEESACLAVKDHLPEKDGIFAGLLVAEMISVCGLSLSQLLQQLFKKYGRMVCVQENLPLTPQNARKLEALIKNPPGRLGKRVVQSVETMDGLKLDFSGDAWLILRFSGTEPLIRCYAEAGSEKEARALLRAGRELL